MAGSGEAVRIDGIGRVIRRTRQVLSDEGLAGVQNRVWNRLRRIARLRLVNLDSLYSVWEPEHLKRLLSELQVDCVFDVGANYGQYAEMLRRRAGFSGLIVSFEPMPWAAQHLRRTAARDGRWVVEEKALSSACGTATFHIMEHDKFSSLSTPRHDETGLFAATNQVRSTIQVETETLSHAYRRLRSRFGFSRPFLKLDTQGYDIEIVRSGADVVAEFVGLQSELAVQRLYEHSVDIVEALSFYRSLGFTLSAFVPNNAGHFPYLVETDGIFVRAGS